MRKSRLSYSKQLRLMEHFVAESTARYASELVGVNRKTGSYYYHRLRVVISIEREAAEFLAEKLRLMRVVLVVNEKVNAVEAQQVRCLFLPYLKGAGRFTPRLYPMQNHQL